MTTPLPHFNSKIPPLQIKVFSRWASSVLRKRGIVVKDATTQFTTGVNLVNLAEVLTGETKHQGWTRNPTKPFQKVENCDVALKLFIENGVNIVNCTSKDITDGNVKCTMELLWTLILKYTIEPVAGVPADTKKMKSAMYQAMMRWFLNQACEVQQLNDLKPYYLSVAALISSFHPEVLNFKKMRDLKKTDVAADVIRALNVLEVPVFLDPEDLLGEIDEKSLLTQMSAIKKVLQPDEKKGDNELFEEDEDMNSAVLDLDIEDESQIFPKEVVVYEEPQSHRPFMLLMTINDFNTRTKKVMAMTAIKTPNYLNSAGLKIDLDVPNPSNPAQLFTFGEGEWITVIDSVMQPGMVWDVADRDNLNPPEGTPFYMFMFHGRHNQRFTYKNGHIIAKQNGQVVTYVGGAKPMVMMNDNSSLLQTFRLQYV